MRSFSFQSLELRKPSLALLQDAGALLLLLLLRCGRWDAGQVPGDRGLAILSSLVLVLASPSPLTWPLVAIKRPLLLSLKADNFRVQLLINSPFCPSLHFSRGGRWWGWWGRGGGGGGVLGLFSLVFFFFAFSSSLSLPVSV